MTNLTSQTSYELTSMIISSEDIAYKLGSKTYTTLKTDFVPEMITDIKIHEYQPIKSNESKIDVVFTWEPARDETCSYEFVINYEGSNILQRQKRFPNNLLFYHIEKLPFGATVNVAVRGQNPLKPIYESETHWITLKIDDCMKLKNDPNICGPDDIEDLNETVLSIGENEYTINFTWTEPSHYPDKYELEIHDINPKIIDEDGNHEEPRKFEIDGVG